MRLPFTLDDFLSVFRSYNEAIGAAPLLLMAAATVLVLLAHTRHAARHRVIASVLALLWIWSGTVYHWGFFAHINAAARLFGALFVIQGILLVTLGAVAGRLRFAPTRNWPGIAGWILVLYALVGYPLAGWALGHGYPSGPSFGAPCPLTIFFIGMMLWSEKPLRVAFIVIPVIWAVLATSAAAQLGMREDFGLTIGAVVLLVEVARQRLGRGLTEPTPAHAAT